ncbi:MAG: sensor histidine kinase [Desulfatibacillaceae bacterium]
MKRLRLLILVFVIAVGLPLGYMALRTYESVRQEEVARFRYFAQTLFDDMEASLAELVIREENRPVDDYAPGGGPAGDAPMTHASEPWITGWFQNNPDGSYLSPGRVSDDEAGSELALANTLFNALRAASPEPGDFQAATSSKKGEASAALQASERPEPPAPFGDGLEMKDSGNGKPEKEEDLFAGNYVRRKRDTQDVLGSSRAKVQKITPEQAHKVQRQFDQEAERPTAEWGKDNGFAESPGKARRRTPDRARSGAVDEESRIASLSQNPGAAPSLDRGAREAREADPPLRSEQDRRYGNEAPRARAPLFEGLRGSGVSAPKAAVADRGGVDWNNGSLSAEIAPMQAVLLDDQRIFLFRRVALGGDIYRQGLVIDTDMFVRSLVERHYRNQPMARFARLDLSVRTASGPVAGAGFGPAPAMSGLEVGRNFPRPFSFLHASLAPTRLPESAGRRTLTYTLVVLGAALLIGLFAIYHSAATVQEAARRRSVFVSSVTHELKTPLTNIRMYIEMLEQGMARDRQRESEYFGVLGSESARLSRLINNVLEFSKLETRGRRFDYRMGDFSDVMAEAARVMGEKLRQEGFSLEMENRLERQFAYDPDVMVQILVNLMENSMKFARTSPVREISVLAEAVDGFVDVSVSDTGPGIPPKSLDKVFDDFYRAEPVEGQAIRGTGIGLALVRKFARAMGGDVRARNNAGAGCTIRVRLPRTRPGDAGPADAPRSRAG